MSVIPCISLPCFVENQIINDPEGWILESKVSTMIGSDDPWLHSVTEYLDCYCTTTLDTELREDPSMMFGEATQTRYRMHEDCPGTSDHRCIENT